MRINNLFYILPMVILVSCSQKKGSTKQEGLKPVKNTTCADSNKVIRTLSAVQDNVKAERYLEGREIVFLETDLVKKRLAYASSEVKIGKGQDFAKTILVEVQPPLTTDNDTIELDFNIYTVYQYNGDTLQVKGGRRKKAQFYFDSKCNLHTIIVNDTGIRY